MKNSNNSYRVYRILLFLCLILIFLFAALYYFEKFSEKEFAIASGVIALIGCFFAVFANKPLEKDDVSIAIDKVLRTYDQETFQSLKEAKEEEGAIRNFIESRSNEIFLVKLRSYLVESIESKYKNSELSKLITELEIIETKLNLLKIQYDPIQLPERFTRLINKLNQEERFNLSTDLFLEMINIFPFLPFKSFWKACMKYTLYLRRYWLLRKDASTNLLAK